MKTRAVMIRDAPSLSSTRFNLTPDKTRMQIEISSCERWMMLAVINGSRGLNGGMTGSESGTVNAVADVTSDLFSITSTPDK